MSSNTIFSQLMPAAIGIIMLGLGLSLTIADFTRILRFPKAVLIGLSCQMILLPLVCFAVATGFSLAPELAVGLMLLSASPGGATANLYSHLSKGNVALNITLTAINSLLTLFTIPLIVNLSLQHFMDEGQYIPMQLQKVIEVFAIVLIPVLVGMLIKKFYTHVADKLSKPVKIASAVLLAAIILFATWQEFGKMSEYFVEVGIAALVFNLLSICTGYFVPRLFNLAKSEAIAIGMEIGIHNGALAIYIATNILNNYTMSIPPAIYSILMFFTAAAFGMLVNMKRDRD